MEIPVMLTAFPLKDDQGVFLGGEIIIQDLTFVKGLEKERRHLVNMFAHDLKTPVVGMGGLLRRLIQGKVGSCPRSRRIIWRSLPRRCTGWKS